MYPNFCLFSSLDCWFCSDSSLCWFLLLLLYKVRTSWSPTRCALGLPGLMKAINDFWCWCLQLEKQCKASAPCLSYLLCRSLCMLLQGKQSEIYWTSESNDAVQYGGGNHANKLTLIPITAWLYNVIKDCTDSSCHTFSLALCSYLWELTNC